MAQVGETYRNMESLKRTVGPAKKAPSDAVRPGKDPGLTRKTMPYTPGKDPGLERKTMPYTPPKDGSGPGIKKMPFNPNEKLQPVGPADKTRPAAKKVDRTAERIAQTEAKRNAIGAAAKARSLAKQRAAKAKKSIRKVD